MNNVTALPTPTNTVMTAEQVSYTPIYAQVAAVAPMFNVSKSTVRRWLKDYEADNRGVEGLYIDYSSTLTLINIQKLAEYLEKSHKKHY